MGLDQCLAVRVDKRNDGCVCEQTDGRVNADMIFRIHNNRCDTQISLSNGF